MIFSSIHTKDDFKNYPAKSTKSNRIFKEQ